MTQPVQGRCPERCDEGAQRLWIISSWLQSRLQDCVHLTHRAKVEVEWLRSKGMITKNISNVLCASCIQQGPNVQVQYIH